MKTSDDAPRCAKCYWYSDDYCWRNSQRTKPNKKGKIYCFMKKEEKGK